jgi:hypothetical protein
MTWQETSVGRYERNFDSLEHFYRAITSAGASLQKQHYFLSGAARLKRVPPATVLQRAWKALRHRYPQMAAEADESGSRFVYTVPSPKAVEAWLQETFIVEPESRSATDLYSTLQPSSAFKLYYIPQSRELLFRVPHWRIDGIGLLHLQEPFFRILAQGPSESPFDGSEVARLAPSLDEAASVPQELTPVTSHAADAELAVLLNGMPAVSMVTLPNAEPTIPRRTGINLATDLTARIIRACKGRGITVTTGVHAALVLAMQPYMQHDFDPATRGAGGGKYTCFNPLDVRKHLPAPWNGPDAAVSLYHAGLPYSIDLVTHQDFPSIAGHLGSYYGRNLAQGEPRNLFGFLTEYVHKVLGLLGMQMQPDDPLKQPAHPELSSLGIINQYLAHQHVGAEASSIELEDWRAAVEVTNRLLLVYIWTWNGQMHLDANYNQAFYEPGFVDRFLEEWKGVLLTELGVE